MGTISKTDGGRYTVRWRDLDGRQREKTFRLKGEASAWNAQVEADKTRGIRLDPAVTRVTFGAYAKQWIAGRPVAPSTRELHERRYKHHMALTFGNRRIGSIRPGEVQSWVTGLVHDKGLAPSSASVVFRSFASIVRGAVRDGVIPVSPCVGVRPPLVEKRAVQVLTSDQIVALAEAMPSRFQALVPVAGGAGLRQGEAFGLCLDSVRFLERRLTVDRQVVLDGHSRPELVTRLKTPKSRRSVPLAQSVLTELSRHIKEFPPQPDTGVLFTTRRGSHLLRRGAFNAEVWKPAVKKAKLPRETTFHTLRHSYASLLIANGVNLKEVSAWLGHATIAQTADTYGHLYPEADERARQAIERALTGRTSQDVDADADLVLTSGGE